MIHSKILDAVLLPLADLYEANKGNGWISLKEEFADEYEQFCQTMAALSAECSIIVSPQGEYRLTSEGYARYSERIKALRGSTVEYRPFYL